MPIYRVNNTTYNIPDDMSVKFEQRFPNAKIDMYNGEEKYSIPVNEKNNFVKAYPKATFEYQGNDTSSQEQPSAPVQDFQPSQEVKDYALDNIPDMFKSKGNNLSTHPLQTQEDFSGGTSDSMKRRIEQAKRTANDQYMRQFAIEQVFKPKGEKLSTRPLQTQEDFFGETLDFMNRIATDENQRIEQAERAANDPYMRQQEIEHVFKPKNQEQINTVRNLIEEQNKRLDKRLSIHSGSGNNAFNALANSTRYNRETSDDRNQKAVLGYAEKLIEQAQNITDEAKRKGNTNFLAGFYRGFRDTPLDVWAMGLANLRDYAVANQVMDKVDKGKKLNPAEDALMQALVTNAATQMYYAGDLGRGYKTGGAIHESLPFMLDMLLGMGTIQAVTKPAAKSLLKYATEKAAKYGLGKATTGLAKGAARTISGLRDVAAHTATFGSQRVAADYLRRGLGDIKVKPNEDGTVSYDGRENIQTGGEAIGKAIVSTAAETGSELLGEYFGPMLGWIGRATGANRIGKIIPASVGKAYSSLVNSQGFKQVQEIARRAKIADPIGEYGEEVVNNLVSTAIGDMTPEQLVDLDQNIDTFLGVAPMSALFGAAGTAGYLRGQYRNYRNMRQFENRMQEEMGEDWSGVREALQDADIETAREMVKDVLSRDMTPQLKKDAITYISSVLQEQTLQSVDKQSMPEDIAQEKRDIFTNLSNTRRQIPLSDEQLDEVISRVESQGPTALTEMGFTPEQQDMIMSYNDAYQDYNNYTFWVQDTARNARRQAEQQVESLTNATTGTVMRVKAGFSQEPVNILRGNIAFDAEGKVDREKSDNVVYYLDKDGKVQMSSIDAIENVIDDSPAEEVAEQAGNDAENEILQSEETQINPPIELGTVFRNNGQNLIVARKTPQGYEIAAVDDNGELIPEVGTQEVSEEDLRNAIAQSSTEGQITNNTETAPEQPVSTETQPESPVQGESSETSQEQKPQTALSRIPTNDKGEQDFEAAPAEDTGAALMEISEGDIDDAKDTADQMILSYQEQLKKADKMKTTGASIQEIVKLKQEKKEAIRQINDKIRYWQSVSDAIEKKRPGGIIAEAKKVSDENQQRLASMTQQEQSEAQAKIQENIDKGLYERPSQKRAKTRYVKEDNELGQANTPMEHVLREIATGKVSFLWNDNGPTQGLGKHLGYSDSSTERKRLIWAFSNELGMTPEAASEAIHADMPENLQGMVTDQDIFNMIVQAFQEYGTPSKMWKAAKEMHGTDEIESMPGYRQDIERQALEWEASENHKTVQEWIAYCDFIEEELDNMFSSVSDEELNTIFEQINDDYERRNETESAGSTQGQADSKQGDEILPASESDNTGAGEESREQPERTAETDGESGSVVPEPEGGVDNNGYPFLKSSNETTIFGEIREETGLTPAPIKLSEGFNRKDDKGRNRGYGFKHIEQSHGDQIRNYGFESIPEFVESVAKNYTIVRKGNKRNGIDTYILEVSDKKNNTLFVELSKDGSYWNVNSAGVFRKGYSKKKEVVWPLPAVEDASTAEDTGVQNAADSSNSMSGNSPQNASFIDKDTQSLEEKQEDKKKFTASEINQGEGVIEYAQRIAKEKEIWDESQKVDINPTEGQKEAGNYKMGHVKVDGMDITIESPKGSVRSGKDADGNEWSVTMNNDYGYIRGTEGVDGDHIDVFLSDNPEQGNVYVIDQINQKTGEFDESKIMYGFDSMEDAKEAYLSNFEEGWKVGIVSGVTKDEFRKWIESSVRKTKPFSEYKSVNVEEAQNEGNELTKERTEPKFLSESEYIERKTEEDFKNSGIEDRQEWDESDESLDSFNNASDEYPNYISNLSKSGELQRIYDQSSIGEKIKIRESVEAAGYEINELIDTSKEKSTAKKKRESKREKRSKELMEKLGINSEKNNDIVPSGKENVVAVSEMGNTTNIEKELRFRETDVSFSDFAAKHKLNEADVKKYAQSMRNGNLGGASYAFKSIQRSIRLQNENLSLGQFVKVFSPIKKELYAKFGDIDSLREEYIQREIEERNMMEAAKKRIEEEKKAENERLLEFENMSDQEMDEAYFKALENNDKSRMRDIVNESARRKGYMSTGEFRMSHRAPSYDEEGIDKSMIDVANNKDNIRDSLNEQMRMNQDKNRKESVNAINNALSSIEKDGKAMVTIYRAVPKSIKESNVRNGDWVTLSESYAKQHGNHALEGSYRIIKEEVPAENLYWDGNDINEWGYDDRNDYRYKDTKNNRKLNDLVTRDDNGNIIPPSKRFNSRKKDTRFRFIGEQGAANLDAAEEANTRLDNLAVAREMEKSGKDAKAIKMATGWERGADGKWRYETADFEYYPSGDARKDKLIENRQWYNEYMTLVKKLLDGETLTEKEQARYDEFYEQEQEARKQYESTDKIYLDDYIKDDELFNAYPELKRTKVLFVDKSNGEAGSYLKKDNTITININSEIEARSILAHEIQHAIQRMEGFATGGNYKSVLLFFKENPEVEIKFVVDETYKEAKNRGIDITKEELYKMFTESDDVAQGIENEIIDRNNITESELGEVYNSGVDAGYRAISGEVEARNVQSRLNMTPEERRNTLASETEDVAREDQIFLYDSMSANNMIIDTNQISEDIKREVEKTAKSLNIPAEVITSTDQIKDESVRKAIESGRKIKGWYSLSDRKVYVYLPNTSSIEDARQTILHEGVAHFGLRKLVGDENMDSFLDEIFANVTKEVRERIISTLPRYGWDSRVATEEYLASMAENGVDVTVWQRIRQAFKNLLRKLGIRIEINDNELRYILWRSRQNLESGNVLDMAKDIAMQYEMGVGNYYRNDNFTSEEESIINKSISNGTYMKAPNGVNSNLNEKQWVQVRTKSFKEWFGDWENDPENASKVIDENGEPLVVYHGTDSNFTIFDRNKSDKGKGFFFSSNKTMSKSYGNNIMPVFLNIRSIYPVEANGSNWDSISYELNLESKDKVEEIKIHRNIMKNSKNVSQENIDFFNNRYYKYADRIESLTNKENKNIIDRIKKTVEIFILNQRIKSFDLSLFVYGKTRDYENILEGIRNGIVFKNVIDYGPNKIEESKKPSDVYVCFSPYQVKSAINNSGNFDINNPDIRFRENTEISDGSREKYEESLKGWRYKATEAYQDSMLSLKNLQDIIAEVSGKPIKSFENAYMAENQLSSKNTAEAEKYYKNDFVPMLEAAGKMMKKYGLTQKAIERYMMLAHGIERNVEMSIREQANEIMKDSPDDAQQFIDDFRAQRDFLRQKYSGYEYLKELSKLTEGIGDFSATQAILESMDGNEHADFQNDALEQVRQFEDMYDVKELWEKTNKATKNTLRKTYESGMMGRKQFDNVSDIFMYYVPLRGWSEKTAEDVYEYINSERNPVNSVLRSMKGRKSIPDEVFATIGNMAESAILQGNRNMMKQNFMSMVMNHPTDLATMRRTWYVYDNNTGEWHISTPEIEEKDTAAIIEKKISDHEERMKQLEEKGLATQTSSGLNIDYRIQPKSAKEHVVQVKNGGKDYTIYVNANPRAAQAINGMTNPDVEKNPIFKAISTANRWLAANFTTRNPAFVLSNLSRDLIFSMSAVYIKEDGKYSARYRKNLLKTPSAVFRNIRGKGNPNTNEIDRYFQEFIENGGETGYMHLNDVDKYKKKVRAELAKIDGSRGSAKAALDYTLERLEDFNRWAEDISRFTVYMTSRQMGRTVQESVNDAKEITVNFNKKGAGYKTSGFFGLTAGMMRNLYLFFNASVQSLTNFKRLAVRNKTKFFSILGGFSAAGMLMPVINSFLYNLWDGGDDDPYNDLPEWVRRNNLCIYAGNGKFVTIPLPIELRAFYGIGDMAYRFATGKEKATPTNVVKSTVNQLAELLPLNPTGNEGLKTFMPDALAPIFEAYVWNEDFTGKPVAKITPFNERDPEWKRVYKGTSGWLVDTSKFLNDLSNGSGPGKEFRKGFLGFNPAKVEHLLESYFGGMAKTLNQAGKTIYYGSKSIIEGETDEDLTMRNTPILNRFINKIDDRNAFSGINREYFNLKDEMEQFKYELNGVKKNYRKNPEEYKEMVSSDDFRRYVKYRPYEKRLSRLNQIAKETEGEERERIEEMIIETRREAINAVK